MSAASRGRGSDWGRGGACCSLSTSLFTFFGQLLVYLTPSIALAGLIGGGTFLPLLASF